MKKNNQSKKYIFDKRIFWINMILCIALVLIITIPQGLKVFVTKTEIIKCPEESLINCEFYDLKQREMMILQPGEEISKNKYDQKRLNIANYGVWIIMLISLIINHIVYNKGYFKKLKKEIKIIN